MEYSVHAVYFMSLVLIFSGGSWKDENKTASRLLTAISALISWSHIQSLSLSVASRVELEVTRGRLQTVWSPQSTSS